MLFYLHFQAKFIHLAVQSLNLSSWYLHFPQQINIDNEQKHVSTCTSIAG
jgi:hypothetical protein